MKRLLPLPLFALSVLPATAHPLQYHAQSAESASWSGFLHPFSGYDHLLVMVAVGLWAVRLGGRALWLLPASFVSSMILGACAGTAGHGLPMTEHVIIASLLLLGVALGMAWRPSLAVASLLVGAGGLFHGMAHGGEMPAGTSPILFLGGMVLATTLLHTGGIMMGSSLGTTRERFVRGFGFVLALAAILGAL